MVVEYLYKTKPIESLSIKYIHIYKQRETRAKRGKEEEDDDERKKIGKFDNVIGK